MNIHIIYFILVSLQIISVSSRFYLLDGRASSCENNRYTIGNSYYYSKLLCTEEFVNSNTNTTKSMLLRNSAKQE